MQLIRGLHNLKDKISHCALTIGNFDGLHLGHQALIQKTIELAREQKIPSVLMTFEPNPNEFFTQKTETRLMRLRDKYQRLSLWGLDYLFCIRFNKAFSQMSAEHFVRDLLLKQLGLQVLVIGDDFRFGAKRLGDAALLEKMSKENNFSLTQIPSLIIEGERVSSTRIRKALAESHFSLVEKLLDRPYSLSGRVSHGDKRGRELGYPTANIILPRRNPPIQGIFVVQVKGLSNHALRAVASLGTRPMFDGKRYLLEANIFDFNHDIYGQLIEVEFLHKLRDEKTFSSLPELIQAIDEDARKARNFLA